ncbi:MAG TPA: ferric reductase-like transmembrane domain-containing protein [Solirubrobacteraceae bacterium]
MSGSALWYLTRGTGVVTLVLLTISVALGVANVRRAHTARWPRFVFDALHRNASLLALAFLAVHVATSVVDTYTPIRLIDAVIPFASAYRPVWLGLGAVALDLLIAVALTSVLRRQFGHRAWRATHWLAYACWPVALVHGLGTGSDVQSSWMLTLTAACVLVVLVAIWVRAAGSGADRAGVRLGAVVASVAAVAALTVWLSTGPLHAGWAKSAGTPSSLLRASTVAGQR